MRTFGVMDLAEAQRLAKSGRFGNAEPLCRAYVNARPSDPRGWNLLGTIALGQGRVADAIAGMARAADLAPGVARYRINLAAALGQSGRHAEAADQLTVAVRLAPDVPELWNNVGATLEKLDRPAHAVEAYRRAIALKPEYADAHFNLGNALRKTGRASAAVDAYRKALELTPDRLSTLANLAPVLGDGQIEGDAGKLKVTQTFMACEAKVRVTFSSPGVRDAFALIARSGGQVHAA